MANDPAVSSVRDHTRHHHGRILKATNRQVAPDQVDPATQGTLRNIARATRDERIMGERATREFDRLEQLFGSNETFAGKLTELRDSFKKSLAEARAAFDKGGSRDYLSFAGSLVNLHRTYASRITDIQAEYSAYAAGGVDAKG